MKTAVNVSLGVLVTPALATLSERIAIVVSAVISLTRFMWEATCGQALCHIKAVSR